MRPDAAPYDEDMHEHVLVCVSPSPSSPYIIRTAAKMASAFGAEFTALYVQTPTDESMSEQDRTRLNENIKLAEEQGADLVTVYGEDIASQIAEFVRVSGVTKIVLGRSNVSRRHFWNKPPLTEKLTDLVPSADIHIIPDVSLDKRRPQLGMFSIRQFIVYPKDLLIMVGIIALVTAIGRIFGYYGIDPVFFGESPDDIQFFRGAVEYMDEELPFARGGLVHIDECGIVLSGQQHGRVQYFDGRDA